MKQVTSRVQEERFSLVMHKFYQQIGNSERANQICRFTRDHCKFTLMSYARSHWSIESTCSGSKIKLSMTYVNSLVTNKANKDG